MAQDGPRKGCVEIEDCAGGQISRARILVNERDFILIQLLRALLRPFDVRRLHLDTHAACWRTNGNHQGNMAQDLTRDR